MVENEVAPGDLEARKENKRSPPKTKFSDLARKQGKNIANQNPQDDGKTRHKECLPKKKNAGREMATGQKISHVQPSNPVMIKNQLVAQQ